MFRSKRALLPALAVSILVAVALVVPAYAAAAPRFGCVANAVQAALSTSPGTLEPTVAGSSACANAGKGTSQAQSAGPLRFGATGAFTHVQQRKEAPGAASLASLTDFHVSGSGDEVSIAAAQANVAFACVGGAVQPTDTSQVSGLAINGKPVALPNGSETERMTIDSHGSYIVLNRATVTGNSRERVAAFVHIAGTGDFTIAEALVTEVSSNPCAKTSGFPASVHPCAPGATYDPGSQKCLITAFTKRPIFVSTPFSGPIGVAVYSLGHARAVTRSSNCLRKRGANYVMVGAPGAGGLIVGTRGADRIVTLSGNYTIEGRGGRDCISVGRGGNRITDGNANVTIYGGQGQTNITVGNGNDRILLGSGISVVRAGKGRDYIRGGPGHEVIRAGSGNDRVLLLGPGVDQLNLGNGKDYVHGGAGTDRITVGDGHDTIHGGAGFDVISAGNGDDTILAGPGIERISAGTGADSIRSAVGFDQITARGAGAQVTCVDRARVTVPGRAVGFARAHGCKLVAAG